MHNGCWLLYITELNISALFYMLHAIYNMPFTANFATRFFLSILTVLDFIFAPDYNTGLIEYKLVPHCPSWKDGGKCN